MSMTITNFIKLELAESIYITGLLEMYQFESEDPVYVDLIGRLWH